jgi:hypothetical protein
MLNILAKSSFKDLHVQEISEFQNDNHDNLWLPPCTVFRGIEPGGRSARQETTWRNVLHGSGLLIQVSSATFIRDLHQQNRPTMKHGETVSQQNPKPALLGSRLQQSFGSWTPKTFTFEIIWMLAKNSQVHVHCVVRAFGHRRILLSRLLLWQAHIRLCCSSRQVRRRLLKLPWTKWVWRWTVAIEGVQTWNPFSSDYSPKTS